MYLFIYFKYSIWSPQEKKLKILSKLLQLLEGATVATQSRFPPLLFQQVGFGWLVSSGGFVCLFLKSALHEALKKSPVFAIPGQTGFLAATQTGNKLA